MQCKPVRGVRGGRAAQGMRIQYLGCGSNVNDGGVGVCDRLLQIKFGQSRCKMSKS